MRRPGSRIPLKDVNNHPVCFVTSLEAEELATSGDVYTRVKHGRITCLWLKLPRPVSFNPTTSLGVWEILANAGLVGSQASQSVVRAKVSFWREV